MDPIIGGALISSGTNMAGNLIGQLMYGKRRKHAEGREDTAVQRRAADMEAAGMSKNLAAGQAASSSASQPPAPTNPLGEVDPMMIGQAMTMKEGITKTKADTKVSELAAENAKKTGIILDEQLLHLKDVTADNKHNRGLKDDSPLRTDAKPGNNDIAALVSMLTGISGARGGDGSTVGFLEDLLSKVPGLPGQPPSETNQGQTDERTVSGKTREEAEEITGYDSMSLANKARFNLQFNNGTWKPPGSSGGSSW